jgi:hypothetical protein
MTAGTVFAQHARGFRLVRGDREIQRRPRMRAATLPSFGKHTSARHESCLN